MMLREDKFLPPIMATSQPDITGFLGLPVELLTEVLEYVRHQTHPRNLFEADDPS